jgi:hypothetical protein
LGFILKKLNSETIENSIISKTSNNYTTHYTTTHYTTTLYTTTHYTTTHYTQPDIMASQNTTPCDAAIAAVNAYARGKHATRYDAFTAIAAVNAYARGKHATRYDAMQAGYGLIDARDKDICTIYAKEFNKAMNSPIFAAHLVVQQLLQGKFDTDDAAYAKGVGRAYYDSTDAAKLATFHEEFDRYLTKLQSKLQSKGQSKGESKGQSKGQSKDRS